MASLKDLKHMVLLEPSTRLYQKVFGFYEGSVDADGIQLWRLLNKLRGVMSVREYLKAREGTPLRQILLEAIKAEEERRRRLNETYAKKSTQVESEL